MAENVEMSFQCGLLLVKSPLTHTGKPSRPSRLTLLDVCDAFAQVRALVGSFRADAVH